MMLWELPETLVRLLEAAGGLQVAQNLQSFRSGGLPRLLHVELSRSLDALRYTAMTPQVKKFLHPFALAAK